MRKILVVMLVLLPGLVRAQFAPAQDKPGTTAMHADSSAFVAWATGCVVEPGPMNIANPGAGMAGTGWPASNVIGYPEGTFGVACLGDGGMATVTFASPVCDRPGPDFAVFENGYANTQYPDLWFLELGFVEVSSDGENFFRFPAYSNTQTLTQVDGMGYIDPSQIHNLASKYGAMYGTPFDLEEVPDDPLLDKNNITHVRIIDVVGNIDPEYASYDCQGHPVNDPWPTPFASGGMDLDAVGVIHDIEHFPDDIEEKDMPTVSVYPNPADDKLFVNAEDIQHIDLYNVTGQMVLSSNGSEINVSELESGMYLIRVCFGENVCIERIIIR